VKKEEIIRDNFTKRDIRTGIIIEVSDFLLFGGKSKNIIFATCRGDN